MPIAPWVALSRVQLVTNLTRDSLGIASLGHSLVDRYWQERDVPLVVQRLLKAWKQLESTTKECLADPVMQEHEGPFLNQMMARYGEVVDAALAVVNNKDHGVLLKYLPSLSQSARKAIRTTKMLLDFRDEIMTRSLQASAMHRSLQQIAVNLSGSGSDTSAHGSLGSAAADRLSSPEDTEPGPDHEDITSDIQSQLMSIIPIPNDAEFDDAEAIMEDPSSQPRADGGLGLAEYDPCLSLSMLSLYAGSTVSTESYEVLGPRRRRTRRAAGASRHSDDRDVPTRRGSAVDRTQENAACRQHGRRQ